MTTLHKLGDTVALRVGNLTWEGEITKVQKQEVYVLYKDHLGNPTGGSWLRHEELEPVKSAAAIWSLEEITQFLRDQATKRSTGNDDGGVLQGLANQLQQWIEEDH